MVFEDHSIHWQLSVTLGRDGISILRLNINSHLILEFFPVLNQGDIIY